MLVQGEAGKEEQWDQGLWERKLDIAGKYLWSD